MRFDKLTAMPTYQMILLWVGSMTSMMVLYGILDAVIGGSYESKEFVMTSMAIAIIAWGMFDFQQRLAGTGKYIKLFAVLFLYVMMIALSLYSAKLFGQMWVILVLFPITCSLLTSFREYRYWSLFFLLYFIGYTVFGPADPAVDADASVLTAVFRVLISVGSVLLGGIIINARHRQKRRHEERALQQQKQQVIHMLQCFIPVGERKTQTSRKEISEMSALLKALWKEYGGGQSKDWEIELLSLLHFVSRVKLPDYMFEKEGKLSEFELEVVQEHCFMAKELCEGVPGFLEVQNAFLYHHEKINGTGYPYRLRGSDSEALANARLSGSVSGYDDSEILSASDAGAGGVRRDSEARGHLVP